MFSVAVIETGKIDICNRTDRKLIEGRIDLHPKKWTCIQVTLCNTSVSQIDMDSGNLNLLIQNFYFSSCVLRIIRFLQCLIFTYFL
jgi:hypothetical protein